LRYCQEKKRSEATTSVSALKTPSPISNEVEQKERKKRQVLWRGRRNNAATDEQWGGRGGPKSPQGDLSKFNFVRRPTKGKKEKRKSVLHKDLYKPKQKGK